MGTNHVAELRNEEWRAELRKSISAKERTAIKRVPNPQLDPKERVKCYDEVNCGFSVEEARLEASRCLDCNNPQCVVGCPVGNNIPALIKNIERGNYAEALKIVKQTNSLPAVCGRVCPHEKQCEGHCIRNKMKQAPVAIGALERFAADWERLHGERPEVEKAPKNGIKVAAVGSGPAGLAFAGDMIRHGYDVTVFEANHEFGGVLRYGIPEFRLPKTIVDYEVESLLQLGVEFKNDVRFGVDVTYDDLHKQGYQGIFMGCGAGLPSVMRIPGEDLKGVVMSNEYLALVNQRHAHPDMGIEIPHGKRVAIVGGGNTAMDCARTALRQEDTEKVIMIYRRTRGEMPAGSEEIVETLAEGTELMELYNPVEYLADENGHVRAALVQHMELGEPDASGRRRPVPIEGDVIEVPLDLVIVAVGVKAEDQAPRSVEGIEFTKWNTIVVNEETGQSSVPDVFAGGDIVNGGATVIRAMGDGRIAAKNMHEHLQGQK